MSAHFVAVAHQPAGDAFDSVRHNLPLLLLAHKLVYGQLAELGARVVVFVSDVSVITGRT